MTESTQFQEDAAWKQFIPKHKSMTVKFEAVEQVLATARIEIDLCLDHVLKLQERYTIQDDPCLLYGCPGPDVNGNKCSCCSYCDVDGCERIANKRLSIDQQVYL